MKEEPEDWEISIRTDMWNTMDVHQLNVQRELIIDKITLLYSTSITPTTQNIINALNKAMASLNELVDTKFDTGKHRTSF